MEVRSVEKKEKSTALVTVAISAEEFDKAVNKVYNKNKKDIFIPGFRKGKAPRKIVENLYGTSVFHEEAINDVAPEAYMFAVREKELKVVASPSIESVKVEEDKSLTLVINAVLNPEVELGNYKGLEAVRKEVKVDPAEIDAEIEKLRTRNASIATAERPAKFGDTVVIDYEGSIDGVPFEGGKDEGHSLEIGSNSFIPGFEIQLIGVSAGEDTEVNVTFPENYHAEELKGKAAVFKCHVHEVKEKILPELDDEFAKDVSEFDTLEEYRESIYDKIYKTKDDKVKDEFVSLLLDQVIADMKADINDRMITERAERNVEDYAGRLQNQGVSLEQYLQWMGMDRDAFVKSQAAGAEKQIKQELALRKIAEIEGITVTDEDKEKELKKIAESYSVDIETVKNFFNAEVLQENLLLQKAAEFVMENAVALPEPVKSEDTAPAEEAAVNTEGETEAGSAE
jgi:trigger factor